MTSCAQIATMRKGASSKQKSTTPTLQRAAVKSSCQCDACAKKKGVLQRAALSEHAPEQVPDIVHDVLNSPGQPLDRATREFMEDRFNHDFSAVRVHTDARAAESARAVNARAYTVGPHVAFSRNAYAPATSIGRRLLTHELTHVLQQLHAHSEPESLSIRQAASAENEADKNMNAVLRGDPLQSSHRLFGRAIQRFPLNRPAEPDDGKCYVGTGLTPMRVGQLAHTAIQTRLLEEGIDNEVTLKGKTKGRTSRADLVGLWREDEARARGLPVGPRVQTLYGELPYVLAEIGEIKPLSYSIGANREKAKREVENYVKEWNDAYPDIPAVPMRSAPFGFVPWAFGGSTKVVLWRPPVDGVVVYNCPFGTEPEPLPVPVPAEKSHQNYRSRQENEVSRRRQPFGGEAGQKERKLSDAARTALEEFFREKHQPNKKDASEFLKERPWIVPLIVGLSAAALLALVFPLVVASGAVMAELALLLLSEAEVMAPAVAPAVAAAVIQKAS